MTIHEMRKRVRAEYPHVRIKVRTVGFQDLARADRKCLTIEGDRSADEVATINEWAREAGVAPDGNARFYGEA